MVRNSVENGSFHESFALASREVQDLIGVLTAHREELRNEEVRQLQAEAARLAAEVDELERAQLIAELKCFKDVLSLHRRLVDNRGP